jgi:hypothetical protein
MASAQNARLRPPGWMRAENRFFRACRSTAILEKAKTGRAGPRHPGEAAARRRTKNRQHVADDRGEQAGRRLHVVAAFAKGRDQMLPPACLDKFRGVRRNRSSRQARSSYERKRFSVATGSPGLTSRPMSGGNASQGPSSSPTPRIIRARVMRQTGTSAPVARAASVTPRCRTQPHWTKPLAAGPRRAYDMTHALKTGSRCGVLLTGRFKARLNAIP